MVAGADIFDGNGGIESRLADALLERRAGAMIERAARRHGAGLLIGKPHQFRIDRHGAEAVVVAIAGNHRLRRGGIECGGRSGEVLIEAWLAFRRIIAGAAE